CTKTSGLDKRTGCFQSNINFLQRLVNKNALEASQKLNAADAEIVALKSAVTRLQKTVEQLQAAQKAAGDKKPETKKLQLPLEDHHENPIDHSDIDPGGAVLGGAAIQALHAQAKPPVYMIAINESATRRATRKTTFRLLRNRSKITAASMSRQDRERG